MTTITKLGHYGKSRPSGWMDYRDVIERRGAFEARNMCGYPVAELPPTHSYTSTDHGPSMAHWGILPAEWRDSVRQATYVIFSYETPIAWLTPGGWVVPPVKYSPTTSGHQSTAEKAR